MSRIWFHNNSTFMIDYHYYFPRWGRYETIRIAKASSLSVVENSYILRKKMAEHDNIIQIVWKTKGMLFWARINTISTLDAVLDDMLLHMALKIASGYTTFADFKLILWLCWHLSCFISEYGGWYIYLTFSKSYIFAALYPCHSSNCINYDLWSIGHFQANILSKVHPCWCNDVKGLKAINKTDHESQVEITRIFTSVHTLVLYGKPNARMHAIQRRKRRNLSACSHLLDFFPIRLQIDKFT